MTYQFVSLREQPQHSTTVAEWIYTQWWSETDTPVEAIQRWLNSHLGRDGFPTTIVAVIDGRPVGSVSLHESEAEDRPTYKPYLGALYVTSGNRGLGLAWHWFERSKALRAASAIPLSERRRRVGALLRSTRLACCRTRIWPQTA